MFVGDFALSEFFNLIPNYFDRIGSAITSNFTWFNDALEVIINLFNYLSSIIVWLSSYCGLYSSTVMIIIGLIAGGVGVSVSTYVLKLIVRWWSVLVP